MILESATVASDLVAFREAALQEARHRECLPGGPEERGPHPETREHVEEPVEPDSLSVAAVG